MPAILSPDHVAAALALRDLSDPAHGTHAVGLLLDAAVDALATRWGSTVRVLRSSPVVAVEDNYDRLGYPASAITREARYSRYLGDTVMLRSHTTAGVPPALRAIAAEPDPPADVLLVLPGLVYRRDVVDRMHVGEPHQVDLWRITRGDVDLQDLVDTLVAAVLPGARLRTVPARHPYTEQGRQVDVRVGDDWVELAECGPAAPHVLAAAGLDPGHWRGLAIGMGLDRAVMLRKGVPDIRLLRAADPRIAEQMLDLAPWRPVSMLPAVRRDLSIVAAAAVDDELLGDRARAALGSDVGVLESLTVLARTPHEQLPAPARARLGTEPGQVNLLLRLVLRPLDRTLTDAEANAVRDRVYAGLHEGAHHEWATLPDRQRSSP
ncbi:PheS-related mystery ligase SrmL [Pseudonocardia adelaidensis]|uniref:Phenylalanyl-tRNA synthetase n=1 Tax=Pseudonocardia adelaidensis TaxID=648754 RepID=A0ABP9PAN2_9PSEU